MLTIQSTCTGGVACSIAAVTYSRSQIGRLQVSKHPFSGQGSLEAVSKSLALLEQAIETASHRQACMKSFWL